MSLALAICVYLLLTPKQKVLGLNPFKPIALVFFFVYIKIMFVLPDIILLCEGIVSGSQKI